MALICIRCCSQFLNLLAFQEMAAAFYGGEKGRSALEAAEDPYKGSQRQTDSLVTTQ